MTLKSDAKFQEKLSLGSKNDMRNLANFNARSGKSENLHIMFELKKHSGVMRHYAGDWCKFWKKNDMWFHKWHYKFGKFHRCTQKPWNLHFERLFCLCYKMVSQQTTDALCVITLKGDSKFEEELTGGLKNDISFNRNSQKSKTLHFDELVLWIGYKVSAKNVQKS